MAVRERRVRLARLTTAPGGLRLVPEDPRASPLTPAGYSRFKHGDGDLSRVYGRALAERLIEQLDPSRPVVVTSSGFGKVPPAAHSLVTPVLMRLQEAELDAQPVRIHRTAITDGDYATMSLQDRRAALGAAQLSLRPPRDLSGTQVIALDDVCVTGVHEAAAQQCLIRAGARDITHAYLVDARGCRDDPRTEAALNAAGTTETRTLVEIARSPGFIPNARFCKRVLLLPDPVLEQVLEQLPGWVLLWMQRAVQDDGYDRTPAYADGARRFAGWPSPGTQLASTG